MSIYPDATPTSHCVAEYPCCDLARSSVPVIGGSVECPEPLAIKCELAFILEAAAGVVCRDKDLWLEVRLGGTAVVPAVPESGV